MFTTLRFSCSSIVVRCLRWLFVMMHRVVMVQHHPPVVAYNQHGIRYLRMNIRQYDYVLTNDNVI